MVDSISKALEPEVFGDYVSRKIKKSGKLIGILNEKSGNFTSNQIVKLNKIFGYDQLY